MPKFNLIIKKHEEFGDLGVAIEGQERDYFEPALSGLTLAHDIIEHPTKAHDDGYVDEYMALGGVLAGRIEHGWMTSYGTVINLYTLKNDVEGLVYEALMRDDNPCVVPCNTRIRNKDLYDDLYSTVRDGVLCAYREVDEEEDISFEEVNKLAKNITGWICKGHQLFRKRFSNTFTVATYLYDKIAEKVGNWRKGAEEYAEAELHVNFTTMSVYLEEKWG